MTAEELKKALEESNKALVADLTKAIKGETKTPEQLAKEKEEAEKKAAEEKPVFKGEPTPENIRKFAKEQRMKAILAKVDWSNAESVATMEKEIRELEAEGKENLDELAKAADVKADDSAEVRKLKIDLYKAQKKSNQPEGTKDKDGADDTGLTKEDTECLSIGAKMAKAMNVQRGYKE